MTIFHGYVFDDWAERPQQVARKLADILIDIVGFDKYLEWTRAYFPNGIDYHKFIVFANREIALHECHCNGVNTCLNCNMPKLDTDMFEMPY